MNTGIEVKYDFPNIQKYVAPVLPHFNLSGVDLISKKTFKELFNEAQSKNSPYYLFIAVPKRSNSILTQHLIKDLKVNENNNGKFLLLDANYFQQFNRQLVSHKVTVNNTHYLMLDCFSYLETPL